MLMNLQNKYGIGRLLLILGSSILSLTAYSNSFADSKSSTKAYAAIKGCYDDKVRGFATLRERASPEGVKEIDVFMLMTGLSKGKHAVHIHETAECEPCGGAGGHFDPGPFGFTNPDGNHPYHSGDLINIESHRGIGVMTTRTSRVTLSRGPLSLFDRDGSAFIVHDFEDSYCPNGAEPGCAGGSRAACGIIKLAKYQDNFDIKVSMYSSRRKAVDLDGAQLSKNAYIFLSPEYPDSEIKSVRFYLDGKLARTEKSAPYDFGGSRDRSRAYSINTKKFRDGKHSLAAVINFGANRATFVSAIFSVDNDDRRFGKHDDDDHDDDDD